MTDTWTQRTADDYAVAIAGELPEGAAWSRDPDSDLMKWVAGCAEVWGDVAAAAALLLVTESDPRFTAQLLPDWERAFGLPEQEGLAGNVPASILFRTGQARAGDSLCIIDQNLATLKDTVAPTLTVPQRRTALLSKMTTLGGQSRAFFISLAGALGYPITITEFSPFVAGIARCGDNRPYTGSNVWARCGSMQCGVTPNVTLPSNFTITGDYPHRLGSGDVRFFWVVNIAGWRLTYFTAGAGRTGVDPLLNVTPKANRFRAGEGQTGVTPLLAIARAYDLEGFIRRWKPAHTEVIFNYGQVQ